MPAIYHEGSWLGNATDPEVLVKDTVGWTGKNLLKNTATTQTINGVTFTVNADKSVTVNGTSSGTCQFFISIGVNLDTDKRYILSGCPINDIGAHLQHSSWVSGGEYVIDNGNGVEYNGYDAQQYPNNRVFIFIPNGKTANNLVFKPMIRHADITDPTYEPYHESVEEEIEQIYADNRVLGAKNFCYPAENTKTVNGITFTVNSDNTLTISTVAGGATGQGAFRYDGVPKNTILKLNGCTAGGGASKYELNVVLSATPFTKYAVDYGEGSDAFNVGNNDCMINIVVRSGQVITTPITFKPMLRLASDPDDTYQPYAMTNRELTDAVAKDRGTIVAGYEYERFGGFCLINVNAQATVSAGTWTIIASRLPFRTNNIARAWFRTVDGNKAVQAVVEDVQSSYTQFQIRCEEALSNTIIRGQIIYGIRE